MSIYGYLITWWMLQSHVNSFVAQVFSSETYSKYSYSHMTLLIKYDNQQSHVIGSFWSINTHPPHHSPSDLLALLQWGTKLFQCCKDLDCIAYNPWRKNDKIIKILNLVALHTSLRFISTPLCNSYLQLRY